MSPASRIRTLFSLVVKNVSCEWKCCITTNADEGESVDGNKMHSKIHTTIYNQDKNLKAEKTEHTTIYNQDKNLKSCTTVTRYVLLNLP